MLYMTGLSSAIRGSISLESAKLDKLVLNNYEIGDCVNDKSINEEIHTDKERLKHSRVKSPGCRDNRTPQKQPAAEFGFSKKCLFMPRDCGLASLPLFRTALSPHSHSTTTDHNSHFCLQHS